MRRPAKRIPSLRRWLTGLHEDLLNIHALVDTTASFYPTKLSLFERCVLTLEDRRFFRHSGIDWLGVTREGIKKATFRKHGGASTIDMQFVRTVTGHRGRTMTRKVREATLSYIIQYRYSKIEILRSYLAIAYFGTKLQGSEAAALDVYGRGATDLDLDQAAYVAALLVFPKPLVPYTAWERRHLRRANYIKAIYVRRQSDFDELEQRVFG